MQSKYPFDEDLIQLDRFKMWFCAFGGTQSLYGILFNCIQPNAESNWSFNALREHLGIVI